MYYAGTMHTLREVLNLRTGSYFRPGMIENNEEDPPPPVSMARILKKNMPEWPHILIGSLASIVVSSTVPIFVVLFGDILKVSNLN
jgi:hypothetical protein